jgi:hypothetical protein
VKISFMTHACRWAPALLGKAVLAGAFACMFGGAQAAVIDLGAFRRLRPGAQ